MSVFTTSDCSGFQPRDFSILETWVEFSGLGRTLTRQGADYLLSWFRKQQAKDGYLVMNKASIMDYYLNFYNLYKEKSGNFELCGLAAPEDLFKK